MSHICFLPGKLWMTWTFSKARVTLESAQHYCQTIEDPGKSGFANEENTKGRQYKYDSQVYGPSVWDKYPFFGQMNIQIYSLQ